MHLNLVPLLAYSMNYFTTLIFYQQMDFEQQTYPISVFRAGSPIQPSNCAPQSEEVNQLKGFKRVASFLCDSVRQNYHTKGIRGIRVISIYPPERFGEKEIYWFLNHFWSGFGDEETFYKGLAVRFAMFFRQIFPINIQIQILLTEEVFKSVYGVGPPLKLKREWIPFARLPKLWICIPISEIGKKSYLGEIGVVFHGRLPAVLSNTKMNLKSGFRPDEFDNKIDEYVKNEMGVEVYWRDYNVGKLSPYADSIILNLVKDAFNGSITQNWKESLWKIVLRIWNKNSLTSDEGFIVLYNRREAVVTCSDIEVLNSFDHLVSPYDVYSWSSILFLIFLTSALFFVPIKYRELAPNIPQMILDALLENTVIIPRKFRRPAVYFALKGFIFMGIVFSNGYKGVVTTSLVKPFKQQGYERLDSALLQGNLINTRNPGVYYFPSRMPLRKYCCQTKDGLSHIIDTKDINVRMLNPFMKCRDILNIRAKAETMGTLKIHFHDILKYMEHIFGMNWPPTHPNETEISRIITMLLRRTEVPECEYENAEEYVLSCQKSFLLRHGQEELESIINRGKYDPSRLNINSLYEIKETHNIFEPTWTGLSISPMSIGRKKLHGVIRLYEESGFDQYEIGIVSNAFKKMDFNLLKEHYGKLVDRAFNPAPLSMATNIYYTFVVYFYGIAGTLMLFSIETLPLAGTQCFILSQRPYFWIKTILVGNMNKIFK